MMVSSAHQEINETVTKLGLEEKLEREIVNSQWDSLGGLREYFTQISFTMTNYDQWQFKQKILNLEVQIQKLNQKIPRTKFRFKRKAETQLKTKRTQAEDGWVKTIKGIVAQKDQTFKLSQSDLQDGSFKLVDLENCTVIFEGYFTMLFLRNLKNCTVHTCPVANSIMGFNLHGCKISLIGHQIRLHDSEDTDFYVYTTSRLIIEDCTKVKFHELQYDYPELQSDLEAANLSRGNNLWKEVQDFKWIKKERSPNFQLIFDGKEQAPKAEENAVMYNPVVPIAPVPGKPVKQAAQSQESGIAEPKVQAAQGMREDVAKVKVQSTGQVQGSGGVGVVAKQQPTEAVVAQAAATEPTKAAAPTVDDEDIDEI
jgi:tubulin-specific chaperone C